MKSPFTAHKSSVCLFAGTHTYGTVAAAIYFTREQRRKLRFRTLSSTFIAVISCDVVDDYPVNIQLEREYKQ